MKKTIIIPILLLLILSFVSCAEDHKTAGNTAYFGDKPIAAIGKDLLVVPMFAVHTVLKNRVENTSFGMYPVIMSRSRYGRLPKNDTTWFDTRKMLRLNLYTLVNANGVELYQTVQVISEERKPYRPVSKEGNPYTSDQFEQVECMTKSGPEIFLVQKSRDTVRLGDCLISAVNEPALCPKMPDGRRVLIQIPSDFDTEKIWTEPHEPIIVTRLKNQNGVL